MAGKTTKVKKDKKIKKGTAPKPLKKIGTGSVVEKYTSPKGIVCPAFWNFKPFNGCTFDCQWCYLNGTFFRWRGYDAKKPHMKNEAGIMKDLEKALTTIPGPQMFNCGELADGLLFEPFLINKVIPMFSEYYNKAETEKPGTGHKLLILTKSNSTRTMQNAPAVKSVVFAHSVNAKYVSRRWELNAPHPWERLGASRQADVYGFQTRLRIDPMVPVNNWKIGYRELCNKIMELNPNASVITIGSLRELKSTRTACITMRKDRSWMDYTTEESPFGKRIASETRLEMYAFVINVLTELGYKGEISLCKETPEIWKQLQEDGVIKSGKVRCNCLY